MARLEGFDSTPNSYGSGLPLDTVLGAIAKERIGFMGRTSADVPVLERAW